MSESGGSRRGEFPIGIDDEAGLEVRLATGSDDSAGVATRLLAGVLLALAFPWVITRRVVSKGAPRIGRLLRNGGAAASKAIGSGMRWLAARLALIGSGFTTVGRPIAGLGGRCWRVVGRSSRVLARWANRAGRRAGVLIKTAARPVQILCSWGRGAVATVARLLAQLLRGAGRAIAWALRPLWSAGAAALRRMAAAVGGVAREIGAVVGVILRAIGAAVGVVAGVIGAVVRVVGAAFGALLSAVTRAAATPRRLLTACVKLMWRGLVSALRQVWTATCWTWRRLLAPAIRAIGWVLGWAGLTMIARPSAAVFRFVRASARILGSGLRTLLAPAATMMGRAASSVARAIGRAAIAIATPAGKAVRKAAGGVSAPIRAAATAIGSAVGTRRRAVAQGALVAFGTARHQAMTMGMAAADRDRAWRAAISQPGVLSEIDDQSIAGIFSTESFQNAFLAPGVSQVSAIVSVSADDARSTLTMPEVVELILVDCSASMGHPWEKIQAARGATRAAVEALRDGVWFAVVRGAESAEVVYPRHEGLVQASPETKRTAVKAIAGLQPVGGTAIGRWLTLAADLMSLRPHAIHHAILLTDGKDEDETESELDAALAGCEGLFQCDCRGVGTDWAVSELRKVSSALLGSLDIIADPAAMESDFRLMTEAAMARQLEASLRVWIPNHGRINFLRQVSPAILDLTSKGRPAGPLATDYPTGAWGSERREYHLSVDVRPGHVGAEMLASRVNVVVRNKIVAKALVKAIWTEDETLTAPLSPEVAHYAGQAELAAAIQEGLQARRVHDEELATAKLGRAVQLALQSGNDALTGLLGTIVDVVDAGNGTVRLKKRINLSDEMTLDTRSSKTVRITQPPG